NQKKRGFYECGFFRQLLNRVPAVPQNSSFAIDKGNRTGTGTSIAISGINGHITGLCSELTDIYCLLIFATNDDWQLAGFSIYFQFCEFSHNLDTFLRMLPQNMVADCPPHDKPAK